MLHLFGETLTPEELRRRIGSMDQVAGVRRSVLAEGASAGVETIEVRTGSGFRFDVLPGRGMDIGHAEWNGIPLAWRSPTGEVNPAHYDEAGTGWLRTFHGGLLTGCGLKHMGAPSTDGAEPLPMHGRLSNTPAEGVWAGGAWEGDEYRLTVRGAVREARVFGENLRLERTIQAKLGESAFTIEDTVTNLGFETTPHMYLYHMNIGFPVVSEKSRLVAPVRRATPRDDDARSGLEAYASFPPPQRGFREQVFFHELGADADGMVHCGILRREPAPFGIWLAYPAAAFPYFTQWKMTGEGTYVVGLEPGNALVEGMAAEREKGRLQYLEPGETRTYRLTFRVITNEAEADAFESAVARCS